MLPTHQSSAASKSAFLQTRSEIGIFRYPLAETWFVTLPFLITATPLLITFAIAIAVNLHRHIHTHTITRQRAYLERIWQITSPRL